MTSSSDWTGRVGDVWAEESSRTDRAFAGLAPHLDAAIRAAAPIGHFTALDIGCGAGSTAANIAAARPDAAVVGVDLSDALIAVARRRHAARPNLAFTTGDALDVAAAGAPRDLLFSRHGVMFFADPVAAFTRLHAATGPGGAIVFSCFAAVADNPWATLIEPSLPAPVTLPPRAALSRASLPPAYASGPFAFADQDATEALLAAAGWQDASTVLIRFDYQVGAGDDPVADALAFLTRIGPAASRLRSAAPADRPAIERQLRDRLAKQRNGPIIAFPAAAWIWTARAKGEHA